MPELKPRPPMLRPMMFTLSTDMSSIMEEITEDAKAVPQEQVSERIVAQVVEALASSKKVRHSVCALKRSFVPRQVDAECHPWEIGTPGSSASQILSLGRPPSSDEWL